MPTAAFASTHVVTSAELLGAPVRWPRPGRLEQSLDVPSGKLADGLRTLGIETVGALLEHLPRDRREARTVAQLRPGEQATVAVEVRVDRGAAGPPPRDAPAGGGHRVRRDGHDECGVLQPAVAGRALSPGYAPAAARQGTAGGRLRGRPARTRGRARGTARAEGEIAHYPATVGVSSTQIAALVREHRGALAEMPEPLPAAVRATERLPDRAAALAAMHFPRRPRGGRGGRAAAGVRGAAADAAGAAAPPCAARQRNRGAARGGAAS